MNGQAAPAVEAGRYSQLWGPGQDGGQGEQDASEGARFELGRGERNERPSGQHLPPLTSLGPRPRERPAPRSGPELAGWPLGRPCPGPPSQTP